MQILYFTNDGNFKLSQNGEEIKGKPLMVWDNENSGDEIIASLDTDKIMEVVNHKRIDLALCEMSKQVAKSTDPEKTPDRFGITLEIENFQSQVHKTYGENGNPIIGYKPPYCLDDEDEDCNDDED